MEKPVRATLGGISFPFVEKLSQETIEGFLDNDKYDIEMPDNDAEIVIYLYYKWKKLNSDGYSRAVFDFFEDFVSELYRKYEDKILNQTLTSEEFQQVSYDASDKYGLTGAQWGFARGIIKQFVKDGEFLVGLDTW